MSGYGGWRSQGMPQSNGVHQTPGRNAFQNQQGFPNPAVAAPTAPLSAHQKRLAAIEQERVVVQQKIDFTQRQRMEMGAGMPSGDPQTYKLLPGQLPFQQNLRAGQNGQLPSHGHDQKSLVDQGQVAMGFNKNPNLVPDYAGSHNFSGMPMGNQSTTAGAHPVYSQGRQGMGGFEHAPKGEQAHYPMASHLGGAARGVHMQTLPPGGMRGAAMANGTSQQAKAGNPKATGRKPVIKMKYGDHERFEAFDLKALHTMLARFAKLEGTPEMLFCGMAEHLAAWVDGLAAAHLLFTASQQGEDENLLDLRIIRPCPQPQLHSDVDIISQIRQQHTNSFVTPLLDSAPEHPDDYPSPVFENAITAAKEFRASTNLRAHPTAGVPLPQAALSQRGFRTLETPDATPAMPLTQNTGVNMPRPNLPGIDRSLNSGQGSPWMMPQTPVAGGSGGAAFRQNALHVQGVGAEMYANQGLTAQQMAGFRAPGAMGNECRPGVPEYRNSHANWQAQDTESPRLRFEAGGSNVNFGAAGPANLAVDAAASSVANGGLHSRNAQPAPPRFGDLGRGPAGLPGNSGHIRDAYPAGEAGLPGNFGHSRDGYPAGGSGLPENLGHSRDAYPAGQGFWGAGDPVGNRALQDGYGQGGRPNPGTPRLHDQGPAADANPVLPLPPVRSWQAAGDKGDAQHFRAEAGTMESQLPMPRNQAGAYAASQGLHGSFGLPAQDRNLPLPNFRGQGPPGMALPLPGPHSTLENPRTQPGTEALLRPLPNGGMHLMREDTWRGDRNADSGAAWEGQNGLHASGVAEMGVGRSMNADPGTEWGGQNSLQFAEGVDVATRRDTGADDEPAWGRFNQQSRTPGVGCNHGPDQWGRGFADCAPDDERGTWEEEGMGSFGNLGPDGGAGFGVNGGPGSGWQQAEGEWQQPFERTNTLHLGKRPRLVEIVPKGQTGAQMHADCGDGRGPPPKRPRVHDGARGPSGGSGNSAGRGVPGGGSKRAQPRRGGEGGFRGASHSRGGPGARPGRGGGMKAPSGANGHLQGPAGAGGGHNNRHVALVNGRNSDSRGHKGPHGPNGHVHESERHRSSQHDEGRGGRQRQAGHEGHRGRLVEARGGSNRGDGYGQSAAGEKKKKAGWEPPGGNNKGTSGRAIKPSSSGRGTGRGPPGGLQRGGGRR